MMLKTRNLQIFQHAQKAKTSESAANWNVTGTRKMLLMQIGRYPFPSHHNRAYAIRNQPCYALQAHMHRRRNQG